MSDMSDTVESNVSTDLRPGFHEELDSIRQAIAKLSAGVTELIPRATQILLEQDLEGAEYVILADDEVDARCMALEERCYSVLALQSPVAIDLRQVVAALRIIAEIERSADLAVNLCKAARRIYGHRLDPRSAGDHPEDGGPGPAAVPGGHGVVPDERRHPGGRPR